jgi:hypothetical protein
MEEITGLPHYQLQANRKYSMSREAGRSGFAA